MCFMALTSNAGKEGIKYWDNLSNRQMRFGSLSFSSSILVQRK